ncbi:MAG: bifunctional enoyl-CoA hydratase/phosphate acetyltransferase [Lachnospiraceae bacterium]|nr:bifunctional enoyl-CoA hydratase/phosphate acetyltransferase [Lachnospiraceae bacterium]
MVNNFEEMCALALQYSNNTIAVAAAEDIEVLSAVENARKRGLSEAILVGDEEKIREIALKNNIEIHNFKIINENDKAESCRLAVKQVSDGNANILMKGLVDTTVFLKAVLAKEAGLRTENLLSHVSMFSVKNYHKIIFVTDPAITLLPDIEQKKSIVENAVYVARKFGIEEPYVAPICAIEKFNPKMQATVDAKALSEMNAAGDIKNCYISGPVSLDIALSKKAGDHKGYTDKIAGNADILLMPNIESGNILHKAIVYLSEGQCAGAVVGAKCPIVMTSRADSDISKIYAIAAAVLISN